MILQALNRYYQRKNREGEFLPLQGFENKEIPFILVLDAQGKLVQIKDTREPHKLSEKKSVLRAKTYCVPQGIKKTSAIAANLLWDNAEYVLGISCSEGESTEKVAKRHEAFVALHEERFAAHQHIPSIKALLAFLHNDEQKQSIVRFPEWQEIAQSNGNLSFQIDGEIEIIAEMPEIIALLQEEATEESAQRGICLITGEEAEIARLHTAIKGVKGAQTSGANILSFNLDAFKSYGHEQGYNAPVSKAAAFAYTTALNDLLGKDSRQKIQLGDATTVFWASKKNVLEDCLGNILEVPLEPEYHNKTIPELYASIHQGQYPVLDDTTEFYILGLAPNASRLAVRFWHVATVKDVAANIIRYFNEMDICHGAKQPTRIPIFYLLKSIAAQQDSKNIPPHLAGEFARAILAGLPYPETMFRNAILRNRAEQEISRERAAIIKAYFIRNHRKEITVSLNPNEKDIGYNLGRLFAVLEKIQGEAMGEINATIRDRYYGAASSTPASVFPTLMKLKNHHLSKLEHRGRAFNLERIMSDVMNNISSDTGFPSRLPFKKQGMFAMGYYHQRQDFYTKKTTDEQSITQEEQVA